MRFWISAGVRRRTTRPVPVVGSHVRVLPSAVVGNIRQRRRARRVGDASSPEFSACGYPEQNRDVEDAICTCPADEIVHRRRGRPCTHMHHVDLCLGLEQRPAVWFFFAPPPAEPSSPCRAWLSRKRRAAEVVHGQRRVHRDHFGHAHHHRVSANLLHVVRHLRERERRDRKASSPLFEAQRSSRRRGFTARSTPEHPPTPLILDDHRWTCSPTCRAQGAAEDVRRPPAGKGTIIRMRLGRDRLARNAGVGRKQPREKAVSSRTPPIRKPYEAPRLSTSRPLALRCAGRDLAMRSTIRPLGPSLRFGGGSRCPTACARELGDQLARERIGIVPRRGWREARSDPSFFPELRSSSGAAAPGRASARDRATRRSAHMVDQPPAPASARASARARR